MPMRRQIAREQVAPSAGRIEIGRQDFRVGMYPKAIDAAGSANTPRRGCICRMEQ